MYDDVRLEKNADRKAASVTLLLLQGLFICQWFEPIKRIVKIENVVETDEIL
jgi:hypothetical protein